MSFLNLTVIEPRAICLLGPTNGEFFKPEYAKAASDQFASQVAHLPEHERPTLIVFEDPNGEKVPAVKDGEKDLAKFSQSIQCGWIQFNGGDVHAYYSHTSRSIVLGHNKEESRAYPLAIQFYENGEVTLQLPATRGDLPKRIDLDQQEFAGRLIDFLNSFVPTDSLPV